MYLASVRRQLLCKAGPIEPSQAGTHLDIEDEVVKVVETVETDEEPELKVDITAHYESWLICSINRLIVVVICDPHQWKFAWLDSFDDKDYD